MTLSFPFTCDPSLPLDRPLPVQHHAHIASVSLRVIYAAIYMLISACRVSNASLPGGGGFWSKFKTPKGGKEINLMQEKQSQQAQMSLTRQRLLTICFGDMETIRMVRRSCLIATVN